jgi:glyoxylase-like metal-dependent hydrolase (beta-lactamase superfamily II)
MGTFRWIGVCGLVAVPAALFGFQAKPAASPFGTCCDVQRLADNFYVLKGGGGNSEVFISKDHGVVVVDTKLPDQGSALVEKVKTLTDKPITTVINTHCHADHTGGNPAFPAGVTIVAQENTKVNMEKMDEFKKAENAKFLPTKTFKDKMTLFSGSDAIDLYYFGPGGTNGDAWIVFRSLHILAAGDEFAGKWANLIDESNGGSGAIAKTLKTVVDKLQDKKIETIVPGHNADMYKWADLKDYAEYNADFQTWALSEKKMGKTPEQAEAEYKYPEKYASYTPPIPGFVKRTTQALYNTPGLE